MSKELILYRDATPEEAERLDIDVIEEVMPHTWKICPTCRGEGRNSLHLGAFSGRRLEEARADTEFWDDYMNGRLDQTCESCEGSGKVRVLDRKACSKEKLALWDAQEREDAEYRAMQRAEYLAEGGWREEGWYQD